MAEAVGELVLRHTGTAQPLGGDHGPAPALPQLTRSTGRKLGLRAAAHAALEQRRLFVLLPFMVIAGLVASLSASVMPGNEVLLGGALLLLILLVLVRNDLARLRAVVLCLAFWAGFGLLNLHGALSGTSMLDRPMFGTFDARVDEVLSESAGERRVVISALAGAEGRAPDVRRVRLLIRDGPELAPGDMIRGPMRFTPVPGPAVPGGFDGQFHAYFEGIGAYGSTTKPPERQSRGETGAPDAVIAALRRAIGQRIDAVLPQPSAGVARALINGDQSGITDAVRETMATAGIAHVYSVSGLHLTIVAGGVFFFVRLLGALAGPAIGRLPLRAIAATFGIAAAIAYFAISGGNVAALRSTIMIVLVLVAVITGRRALTMRNVAIAALIVLALDPASVFRPSFQLSFSAVVALVGAYELLRPSHHRQRGAFGQLLGYFLGISLTSLVAGAATLVFSAYHFQQTSPLGVLGNLVTLPLVGFVMMPAAAIAALLMPFGFETLPLIVLGWSIDRMLDLAAIVAALSAGFDASPLLTPLALVIALAALAWFAFFPTRLRLVLPILAIPLILAFSMDRAPDVLISDTTQAIAVRSGDGFVLAAGKPGSFGVRVWEETFARPVTAPGPEQVRCDFLGCIATGEDGLVLALVRRAEAFDEDCARADLIVTRGPPAPSACKALVIDRTTLRQRGVTALYWSAATRSLAARHAIPDGPRPWRTVPR